MALYPPIVEPYLPGFPEESAELVFPYSISPYQDEVPTHIHVKIMRINTNVVIWNKDTAPLGYISIYYTEENKVKIPSRYLDSLVKNEYYKVQIRFANNQKLSEWSSICLIKKIEIPHITLKGWNVDGSECQMPIENPYSFRIQGSFNFGTRQTTSGKYILEDTVQSYRAKLYEGGDTTDETALLVDSGNVVPQEKNIIDYTFHCALEIHKHYSIKIEYLSQSSYSGLKTFKLKALSPLLNNFKGDAKAVPDLERGAIKVTAFMDSSNILFSNFMIKRASDEDGFLEWTPVHIFSFDVKQHREMEEKNLISDGMFPIEEWYDYAVKTGVFYRYSVHIYQKPTSTESQLTEEYIGQPVPVNKEGNAQDYNEDVQRAFNDWLEKNPNGTFLDWFYKEGYAIGDVRYSLGVGTWPAVTISLSDILLYDGEKQLKIQYNPEINSFQRNVVDSKVDTLGSKYPFMRRNAQTNYHSFSLSGLISYHMNMVFTDSEIYNHYTNGPSGSVMEEKSDVEKFQGFQERYIDHGGFLKTSHKENSNATLKEREIFKERRFREEVMDFLYSDQVKLFKSETEGTFLIRLMNISLTPEAQLGRMVYSFSAEAVEIDECNAKNLQHYGLINLGEYDYDLGDYDTKAGQVFIDFNSFQGFIENGQRATYIKDGISIVNPYILERISDNTTNTILTSFSSFEFLRIIFNSPQYLIRVDDGSYHILRDAVPEPQGRYVKGHLLSLSDNNKIIVRNGVFQLDKKDGLNEGTEDNKEITLSSAIKVYGIEPTDTVEVDYVVNIIYEPNFYKDFTNKYEKIGQVFGTFKSNSLYDSLLTRLGEKYFFVDTYSKFCELEAINALDIEAEPGTTFYIQDSADIFSENKDVFYEHTVGPTGRLFLYDENKVINNCYLKGIRLVPEQKGEIIRDNEGNEIQRVTNRLITREVEYRAIQVEDLNTLPFDSTAETNFVFYNTNGYRIFYKGYEVSLVASDGENPLQTDLSDGNSPIIYIDYPSEILFNYVIEVTEGDYKKYERST